MSEHNVGKMKERQYKMKTSKTLYFSVLLGLLTACSKVPIISDTDFSGTFDADEIVGKVIPKWFEGKREFLLEQASDEQTVHMFYDINPEIEVKKATLSYVAVTPQGSDFEFGLDPLSGQHFVNKSYCQQEDIWKSYKEMVYRPPFTLGVIPRLLDELGEPQNIIVFGDEGYIQENFLTNMFDARIVGGLIEQICPERKCLKLDEWQSRIVLVGVQKNLPRFSKVKSFADLKRKIDWKRAKAFIENGRGHNKVASSYYPAYRVGAEVSAEQALAYMNKNSIFLKKSKLLNIRKSCQKLYQSIWSDVGRDSDYEVKIRSLKTNKERREYIKTHQLTSKSLFSHRFKQAFSKHHKSYKTCLKYIYPSNINYDVERHWFLAYYSAVHLLHELGYSFDCYKGVWFKNAVLNNGQKEIPLSQEFKSCSAKKIDIAFERAMSFLDILRKKELKTYRYIDYDKGSFGTHNKVYSWTLLNNKHFKCKKRDIPDLGQRFEAFPKDITWRRRRLKVRLDGRLIK